ncbi:MAG: hypothetical protein ACTSPB_02975 [Candidatus Thorarchaeota archaeon]
MIRSRIQLRGVVTAVLRGPDGEIIQKQVTHNLVTDIGDKFAAQAIYSSAYSSWGMKLGTATTAASKSGAGSFIAVGDYISGSAQALDDSTPKEGDTNDEVRFRRLWAAGEATNATINRVSIVDNTSDAGESDANNTFSTAVFAEAIPKGALDTLTVTWDVTYTGS